MVYEWAGKSPSEELQVFSRLREGVEEEGQQYVIQLLDHFEHEGPNGAYQCIVTELLGPNLTSDIEDLYPDECFPLEIARRFVGQLAMGVNFLHKRGVVHGDLHSGNLLLFSPHFSAWRTQEEVEKYLDEPSMVSFRLLDGTPAPYNPHIPTYAVQAPEPTALLRLCLDDPARVHVKICDFSESFVYTAKNPVERKVNSPAIF